MSFFGFESNNLEKDKRKFLEGDLQETEDLAVYTWGEESYDGLGDALQEGGDELNDETFGGSGAVGKDFDFSQQALPTDDHAGKATSNSTGLILEKDEPLQSLPSSDQPAGPAVQSLESIWDDKSPFSVLPRQNGAARDSETTQPSTTFSPFSDIPGFDERLPAPIISQTGGHSLREVEAEMLAANNRFRGPQRLEEERRLQQSLQQEQERRLLIHQQQQRQMQLQLQQHHGTPPPRVLPVSQSPRFHERQQQLFLLQQQQEMQQQRLRELHEQLQMEEIERRLRLQQLSQMRHSPNQHPQRYSPNQFSHHRTPSGATLADLQAAQVLQQSQRRSPGRSPARGNDRLQIPLQQDLPYLPQNIQMQQRLLAEMAQTEFVHSLQGTTPPEQEALRMEAMRKIMETERMEEKRRRKAAKIAHMARYNDLMTQSDKDFITRIQVSQLVTQDPYAEDFYAQVYGAIQRSRMGLQSQDERVLKFGAGGGVGLGVPTKGNQRRPSAMQKMESQVERIVNNARLREKEKGLYSLHSLQGALGKTSGRSYKAAPRQLLQVDAGNTSPTASAHAHISKEDILRDEGAAKEAAKLGREALGNAAHTDGLIRRDPLSHRQVLVILENLYDVVLKVEQLRRDQPPQDDVEAFQAWETSYTEWSTELWDGLRVLVPLETSNPHPFISLLTPIKGKKLLPRLSRHLSNQQMLTMLTLLSACFSQLDVVIKAPVLDSLEDTPERREAERQTQTFLGSVLQSILPIVAKANLRLISGLLGLLLDRSDIVVITRTRPGLALLTLFLSRVEVIKQSAQTGTEMGSVPSYEELQQWETMLNHLFQLLTPHLLFLFPSTRLADALAAMSAQARKPIDSIDQPVWQFLAALALHANPEQQHILVAGLKEKVLENVAGVNKGWVTDDEERRMKLANVNLFLNALGIDSSQIAT